MTNETNDPKAQADNGSIAVGSIQVGGDVSGNIHIGNVYQYESEEEAPLSPEETEAGLVRFEGLLTERAPVLEKDFALHAKKLRATLGAKASALSPSLKKQHDEALDALKAMSVEALDISFHALCKGQTPPPLDARPPFRGLFAFRPEDREFYFGREALVEKLVERIGNHPFLAVLGASGSGKSSLAMAGLIPALETQMAYLTPSTDPLRQLQLALENADKNSVVVVDQFEELFTLTRDAQEREDFIQRLLDLAQARRVVVTMRADFWGEVASYKNLKQTMQAHQELIAPMDADELRLAMEKQAEVVGMQFESGLSESILNDVKGEPGAMPLLQHALWMLWKRRHGRWLKADEYHAFGGLKQAIASAAEEAFASCSDFERERLRDIFLRLTRLDDSGEKRDTRRRVLLQDLIPTGSDANATVALLDKLANARLIVKNINNDQVEVEVAHEALIRHWKRLIDWLNDDRENLRLRQGVSEDAREWENAAREESLLNHRGVRLDLALAMSKLPRYRLNPIEQDYLNACVEIKERDRAEKERQQRRELEAALAQAKVERRARMVTAGMLAIALILVGVLGYDSIRKEILRQQALADLGQPYEFPKSDVELGSSAWDAGENALNYYPLKNYTLQAFVMDADLVTYGRYMLCIKAGQCSAPLTIPSIYENNENLPVMYVNAFQASQFCAWVGRRLPTDKEWELFARKTHKTGEFYEWTSTDIHYDVSKPEAAFEWTDLSSDPPEKLTVRGGGSDPDQITIRIEQLFVTADPSTGFRCAKSR